MTYNKFTGHFPNIHNLTLLSYIDLSNNDFSGTIPSYLFTMPSLWYINLRQNHLRHPREDINSSETSKLQHLDMANNLLSCRILEPGPGLSTGSSSISLRVDSIKNNLGANYIKCLTVQMSKFGCQ